MPKRRKARSATSDADNEFVYLLHEDAAPDGYLVATDIQFKVERGDDGAHHGVHPRNRPEGWHEVDGASVTMVDESRAAAHARLPRPRPRQRRHRHRDAETGSHVPADRRQHAAAGDGDRTALAAVGFVALLVITACGDPNSRTMIRDPQLEPRDEQEETNVNKPEKAARCPGGAGAICPRSRD